MSPDKYSHEDFERDFNALLENGLIEIVGINKEGKWLYGATEDGKKLVESITENGLMNVIMPFGDDDE